jgi:hypothetical protein
MAVVLLERWSETRNLSNETKMIAIPSRQDTALDEGQCNRDAPGLIPSG